MYCASSLARKSRARRTASAGDEVLFGRQRQVVVFDEDRVEQAGAMVVAAAAADGVLFQSPPAGRCFARVVDPCARACDAADVFARERGDAGKSAEQVQHRPLAREQVAGRTGKFGDGPCRPQLRRHRQLGAAVRSSACISSMKIGQGAQAGNDARLASDDRRPALACRGQRGRRWSSRSGGRGLRARRGGRADAGRRLKFYPTRVGENRAKARCKV